MGMLVVGISDAKLALPPDTLITYALGSCVGICLLDPVSRVAGLSHIMLPDSSMSPQDKNLHKFADTAIPDLLSQMERKGALRSRVKAKIAGGAQMFETPSSANGEANGGMWLIGRRNVNAVVEALRKMNIPLVAQDVLKNYGRTVSFDPTTGIMTVRALSVGVREM